MSSTRTAVEDRVTVALTAATTHLARCPACSRLRALVSPDAACQTAQHLIRACMAADQTVRQEDTP